MISLLAYISRISGIQNENILNPQINLNSSCGDEKKKIEINLTSSTIFCMPQNNFEKMEMVMLSTHYIGCTLDLDQNFIY